MKQSDDSDGTGPPAPRPEIAQQQRPDHPSILALTSTREFGAQPIHFRAGVTEKFEREFCPHLSRWQFMASADQDEPPCSFRLSNHALQGCPTNQEAECGAYVMHRCLGHSIEKARKAKGLPFNPAPKPDRDPRRLPLPDPPDWVTE